MGIYSTKPSAERKQGVPSALAMPLPPSFPRKRESRGRGRQRTEIRRALGRDRAIHCPAEFVAVVELDSHHRYSRNCERVKVIGVATQFCDSDSYARTVVYGETNVAANPRYSPRHVFAAVYLQLDSSISGYAKPQRRHRVDGYLGCVVRIEFYARYNRPIRDVVGFLRRPALPPRCRARGRCPARARC